MIFIHELDTKAERYKEIITLNPYLALYKALETVHDKNRFVLIRSTGSYYDILNKKERILHQPFEQIKNGEEQSIVITESKIDKDLKDFCDELFEDEYCYYSENKEYDKQCPLDFNVIIWFRQDPTRKGRGRIFGYDTFEIIRRHLEEKQCKDMESFKKALMTIDKETLKRFVKDVV